MTREGMRQERLVRTRTGGDEVCEAQARFQQAGFEQF